MISMDDMHEMLNELVDELPEPFFRDLNGGVSLQPQAKLDPHVRGDDLYILGEYLSGGSLGRCIFLYYGSFQRVYGDLAPELLRDKVRGVLRHEFRHHVESLAGENALELEDQRELAAYLHRRRHRPNHLIRPPDEEPPH